MHRSTQILTLVSILPPSSLCSPPPSSGWNMNYPFNAGDLLCCGQTANNYLENNVKVPWDDLRYIFGEIMYGGHIVEDWVSGYDMI